jgi:hypothetical protein
MAPAQRLLLVRSARETGGPRMRGCARRRRVGFASSVVADPIRRVRVRSRRRIALQTRTEGAAPGSTRAAAGTAGVASRIDCHARGCTTRAVDRQHVRRVRRRHARRGDQAASGAEGLRECAPLHRNGAETRLSVPRRRAPDRTPVREPDHRLSAGTARRVCVSLAGTRQRVEVSLRARCALRASDTSSRGSARSVFTGGSGTTADAMT